MKKTLFAIVLLVAVIGMPLFAWEPEDLTKFPPCMDESSWILNLGAGFHGLPRLGDGYLWIPPVHFSLDKNVALGDKGLPFFFGGAFGFSGHGYKKGDVDWFIGTLTPAFRFGYHFNWDVDWLDTYAVTQLGWHIYTGPKEHRPYKIGFPSVGVNIGARVFVADWFGFFLEVSAGSYWGGDIGFVFKF